MSEPKKVLVVDDDIRLVDALELRLTAVGYRVLTAHSGDLGLSVAALFRPDTIILDVRMPEMDGYEVCQTLRSVPDLSAIPIVILSATAQPYDHRNCAPDAYLRKPCGMPELLKVLEHVSSRPKSSAATESFEPLRRCA